ncbi:GNAT family N-acetyltransferase [Shewanella sp. 202IG2-18]|uniref:GNAT family N-acetyltransferase n=1 Tax=Parashewanella hymeniacidonis TaxID=2807618 RepID=UPI00195FACA3|nr:GNAT family N-acetyltransferase [Parashewanella hymeniacidonis]MBM7071991.1 GNAT family N-acetyltransferase [Parashewanella hymeniacidonis]
MDLNFRQAQHKDIETLISMLADDELGRQREDLSTPLNQKYLDVFAAIDADPNNELLVVEQNETLMGMLQLTFIPYLTHIGTWRCLIEGVRIHADFRGQGMGEKMFEYAINRARQRNCRLVQLTSDKQRPDAIRFYEKLGFKASHEGFKLSL